MKLTQREKFLNLWLWSRKSAFFRGSGDHHVDEAGDFLTEIISKSLCCARKFRTFDLAMLWASSACATALQALSFDDHLCNSFDQNRAWASLWSFQHLKRSANNELIGQHFEKCRFLISHNEVLVMAQSRRLRTQQQKCLENRSTAVQISDEDDD